MNSATTEDTVANEFRTVNILLASCACTRAVDAFAISWVKMERQLRRLTANLIFQHNQFIISNPNDKTDIRAAFLENKKAGRKKFMSAIEELSGLTLEQLIGDEYHSLDEKMNEAHGYRNKILHGQQTGQSLSRPKLEDLIADIKKWCKLLAQGSERLIGYDGFSSGSLRKNSNKPEIIQAVEGALGDDWRTFIKKI